MSDRRILVIGGNGTIGSAVVRELSSDHAVQSSGRSTDPAVDLADLGSIETFAGRLAVEPPLDAVVVCAGGGMPGRLDELDLSQALDAFRPKLLGQIAVAKAAPRFVRPGLLSSVTS